MVTASRVALLMSFSESRSASAAALALASAAAAAAPWLFWDTPDPVRRWRLMLAAAPHARGEGLSERDDASKGGVGVVAAYLPWPPQEEQPAQNRRMNRDDDCVATTNQLERA